MAIQIVVVGLGPRGCDWVREIKNSDQYELVACVDTDSAVLQESAAALSVPRDQQFTSLEEALSRQPAGAVLVASSPESHVSACEIALARGKAVMVEKPFTLSLKEAADLVALAAGNESVLLVAQNYRYLRSFRTVRRLINEGLLGRVGLVIMQYYRIPHQLAPSLASLQHSVLWGVGVHHLDALRFVLQKKCIRVLAESFSLPWAQLPAGGSMQVMLELESDIRAIYSATYESSGHDFFEAGQEFYARFVGELATLHVFQRWLMLCERGRLPRIIKRGPRKNTEEQILLAEFRNALTNSQESDLSGRDNLQTMVVVEACIRSATEQRWVEAQELLNEIK